MQKFIFSVLVLASTLSWTGAKAVACGEIQDSVQMCVAIPEPLSALLQDEDVMSLVREEGHIRHLGADERKGRAHIAVSDSTLVMGWVDDKTVTGYKIKRYRWPLSTDFLVQIQDHPALVKLLLSPKLSPHLARMRGEKALITSLYSLSKGRALIRVNHTDPGSYSVIGTLGADGEIAAIDVTP